MDNWVKLKPEGCTCATWWQREQCENNCDMVVAEADRFLLRSGLLALFLFTGAALVLFYWGGLFDLG